MKDRIYIKHWLELKPYDSPSQSDFYYLKITNSVYSSLDPTSLIILSEHIEKEDIYLFCCFLTAYFEDVISQTNILKSFKMEHKKLYGSELPFYDVESNPFYFSDEINQEDIVFLSWYFFNSIKIESFLSPFSNFLTKIASTTFKVFEEEYEYAPENEKLQKFYKFNLKRDNDSFYKIREHLFRVFLDNYLLYPDIKVNLELEHLEILNKYKPEGEERTLAYIREATDDFTFNRVSRLLSLNAKDWSKLLLGQSHEAYKDIASLSEKIVGWFLYKKQNEATVFLEHIASNMMFEVTKKSLDHSDSLSEEDMVYIGLVRYNDQWWFSGNYATQEFDADLILDQKNSAAARISVNFLYNQNEIKEILEEQRKAFLTFNNGSLVVFLKSDAAEKFIADYMDFYNNTTQSDAGEFEKAKKRAREDGWFGGEADIDFDEDDVIIFFNVNNGIEIYNDIANTFPDKNNPFYTKENSDDIMHILTSTEYSTEFVKYFLKIYGSKLSFFKKEPYASYLNHIDFLLRFWKKDNYKTKPTLILTGDEE